MASKKPKFKMKKAAAPVIDEAALAEMDAANATAGGESQARPGSLRRRAKRGEKLTVYLPPETITRLRIACAQPPRRSLSMALTEATELWLAQTES